MKQKSAAQLCAEQHGVDAFRNGDSEADCPHEMQCGQSAERQWWFNGFFSARTHAKFPRFVTLAEMLASILLVLTIGCGPIGVGPTKPVKPATVETVEQAAASSLRLYHERLAAAFTTLAAEIEQGGIEDDEDLANRMEELTKVARLGSFESFRQSWAKQAGADSPWDHTQRASICRETARGFSR